MFGRPLKDEPDGRPARNWQGRPPFPRWISETVLVAALQRRWGEVERPCLGGYAKSLEAR